MRNAAVALGIVLSLAGCSHAPEPLTSLLGAGNRQFRGCSIGDSYKKVFKTVAKDSITVTESGFSTEPHVSNAQMQVRYEFDQNVLYSIQADIFFPDTAQLAVVQNALIERYNMRYGQVEENGGFLAWNEHGGPGPDVEFTLADESPEFGRPKLSLTIYNFDY